MLTRRRTSRVGPLVVGVAMVMLTVLAPPASAAGGPPCQRTCGGGGGSDADASGGSVSVTVRGSGVVPGHDSVPLDTSDVSVHPLCWYVASFTGKGYAEFVESGEAASLDDHSPIGYETIDGWEKHKDDDKGHWYGGICSSAYWKGDDSQAFVKAAAAWFAEHDTVWVDAGQAPPDPLVTPQMLADVAFKAMKIPHGEIHWNPARRGDEATFVGLDTWVWLDDAPTSIEVTASVYEGAIWARVDSTMAGMDVSGDGASSARCPDGGTPWAAGASSDCSIEFLRSSAQETSGTSTITATSLWRSSWVSNADANPTDLDDQTVTDTVEVPVAEIESVATGS